MRARVQDKIKVISLRMEGYSYKEIMEQVPISKGLLSGWLKYIKLNPEQERNLFQRIKERSNIGRAKAFSTNREKRIKREEQAYQEAMIIYEANRSDPVFIAGVCLYWAEGAKRTSGFQFMNSDPEMVVFMVFWVQNYLGIQKDRISLRVNTHADFIGEKYEEFWSETTGIPIAQFRKTIYKPNTVHGKFKKNPLYKGCVRLEVGGGMALLRKVIFLHKILISEMKMLYSNGSMHP